MMPRQASAAPIQWKLPVASRSPPETTTTTAVTTFIPRGNEKRGPTSHTAMDQDRWSILWWTGWAVRSDVMLMCAQFCLSAVSVGNVLKKVELACERGCAPAETSTTERKMFCSAVMKPNAVPTCSGWCRIGRKPP